MARQKQPAVVAELGRPETPEETAARKARDSYLYKKRKTLNNLIYSLLVSLGVLLLIVLIVPRGTGDYLSRNVNVTELATAATATAGRPLADPQLPEQWLAKQAELRFDKDELVTYWYLGYTTPVPEGEKVGEYAAVLQGYNRENEPADSRWVHKTVEQKAATGTETFAGHEWQVYDHHTDSPDGSNVLWAFSTTLSDSTLVVIGTASYDEVKTLATAAATSLRSDAGNQ
ncbi:DUF4245 domain-containing protein [Leucobacter sp. OH2974_COT-288]|nr:DUF4245 domain-containing protein [Leucobacter sp. OH2974_COT-288]